MKQLNTAIPSFLLHCKFEKGLSENTLKFYTIDLKQFQAYLMQINHSNYLQEIDKEVIRTYIQTISGFKPKTIKRKLASLKVLFNFLEFEDVISANPFRKLRIKLKEPKMLPKAMNIQEIKKIFRSVYSLENKLGSSDLVGLRDIAIVELLFATGLRVSELVNLNVQDIDLHAGTIKVKGKGNKERLLHICHKEAISALRNYQNCIIDKTKIQTDYFFINRIGCRLSTQSVRGLVKKYKNYAGIDKRITPHMFRHTFATLLLENDVDIKYIQTFLGHSSILTTQIYTQVNRTQQRKILTNRHPRRDFSMDAS